MVIESSAFPIFAVIRSLLGCGIKYMSCSMLTLVLFMCFTALLFAQVAIWGPQVSWMGYLLPVLPPDTLSTSGSPPMHARDLGAFLTRAFTVLSLALTALALLWRWFRQWRRCEEVDGLPMSISAGLAPVVKHVAIHAGRRMLVGLVAVSAVFVLAFAAIPRARMAASFSHAYMLWVFVVMYVFALVLTVLYLGMGIAADLVLDG